MEEKACPDACYTYSKLDPLFLISSALCQSHGKVALRRRVMEVKHFAGIHRSGKLLRQGFESVITGGAIELALQACQNSMHRSPLRGRLGPDAASHIMEECSALLETRCLQLPNPITF